MGSMLATTGRPSGKICRMPPWTWQRWGGLLAARPQAVAIPLGGIQAAHPQPLPVEPPNPTWHRKGQAPTCPAPGKECGCLALPVLLPLSSRDPLRPRRSSLARSSCPLNLVPHPPWLGGGQELPLLVGWLAQPAEAEALCSCSDAPFLPPRGEPTLLCPSPFLLHGPAPSCHHHPRGHARAASLQRPKSASAKCASPSREGGC